MLKYLWIFSGLLTLVFADCSDLVCLNGGECVTVPTGHACFCPGGTTGPQCENINFPSGLTLINMDEDNINETIVERYRDTTSTGSKLFYLGHEAEMDLSLSLNIRARDIMYPGESYFRTDPTLIQCAEAIITYSRAKDGIRVRVSRSYFPFHLLSQNSPQIDHYGATGTAMILTSDGDLAEELIKIVDAALVSCGTHLLSTQRRSLGLILMPEGVQIHITEPNSNLPLYGAFGEVLYTQADFQHYCTNKLNFALNPLKNARCTAEIAGGVFPNSATSADEVVGAGDSDDCQDEMCLQNVVTYPGTNVGYSGQLYVSSRMFDVIRKLQLYITENTSISDGIHILGAFDIDGSGLQKEGRLVTLRFESGNSENLNDLANFAICSGADYVRLRGDHIEITVKKQLSIRTSLAFVSFANNAAVLSVKSDEDIHTITGTENPALFDSSFQNNLRIGDFTTLGMFASLSSRYLRVDPALALCYDKLVEYDTKWNDGVRIPINIDRGYLTRSDFSGAIPTETEMNHLRGIAMTVSYGDITSLGEFATSQNLQFNVHRLAEIAVKICGPIFKNRKNKGLVITVIGDQVEIQMADEELTFLAEEEYLTDNTTMNEYTSSLQEMYQNAIDGRMVNPEMPRLACERDHPPHVKSIDFRYEHPAHIARRRRRRQVGEEEEHGCVPERNTPFCRQSQPHREKQVEYLWEQFNRKHLYHDEQETREAFLGCFDNCGTCLLGEVYEEKTEHCTNLLHWLPFELMNNAEHSTHLYDRRNSAMKRLACLGEGKQCLFNAPLYAILANSIETLYRPNPERSVEVQLYGATTNPLPIYEILYPMFAINARGLVTVWVESKSEINNLRAPLKAAMLYNKRVSQVKFMVSATDAYSDVTTAIEILVADWARTGCPLNTRDAVAPYNVNVVPEEYHRVKKSVAEDGFSFGEELIQRQIQFEKHWAIKVRN